MSRPLDRRDFLRTSSALAAGLALGPLPFGRGDEPKLRLAGIGVGGMGSADLGQFLQHPRVEVVAICDVDARHLAAAGERAPKAKRFTDWRKMLATMSDGIDAVHVSTPDHTHAPASMSAMNLGKHVYCQKPLTHDVHEARRLRLAAAERKVVTQMGIQIHSTSEYRTAVKLVRDGAIGKVEEVHSFSNKDWGYRGPAPEASPVPDHLAWDLWLGTAPARPYADGHYHPGNWRRWVDFGCGTMGDMGIHILDPVAKALDLGLPRSIVSRSEKPPADSHGVANRVEYEFAGTDAIAEGFRLVWYDGASRPDPKGWPIEELPGQGSFFIGERGCMLLPHIGAPRLFPAKDVEAPKVEPVAGANHWHLWVDACLGGAPTTAGFDYAGPLTEVLLLGVIANRFPGERLDYDAAKVAIPNHEGAHAMLRRRYREGFEVKGL
ncbi:MAG: Gfo/Idh/MocA family oxidoreductase [Planctomycetota bacterium]